MVTRVVKIRLSEMVNFGLTKLMVGGAACWFRELKKKNQEIKMIISL